MEPNLKIIDIKCSAKFEINNHDPIGPKIRMSVVNIIDNELFKIERDYCGRWYQDGPVLQTVVNNIRVYGSRFSFEGEIHPCTYQGYDTKLDHDTMTGSFSLVASIYNESAPMVDRYTPVELNFVANIPKTVINEYELAVSNFHTTNKKNQLESERFMKLVANY